MVNREHVIPILFLFTGLATLGYWIFVALGLFGTANIYEWLQRFPYVSPIADIWLSATGVIYYILWKRKSQNCFIWGIASASSMIFVGLTAFTYRMMNLNSLYGLPEIIETISPAYLFGFGVIAFWTLSRKKVES